MPKLAVDPPALPLSYAELSVFADISTVRVFNRVPKHLDRAGGLYPKRGQITQFSKRSRTRFFRRMATFRNLDKGYFVTLTYPGDFDYVHQTYKRDLHVLRKRMARIFPDIRGIWRLEYKLRLSGALQGAVVPHYHFLLFGDVAGQVSCIEAFRGWIATVWNDIVAPNDTQHLAAGTQVDTITSRVHAMRYAGKYAAKVGETITPEFHIGRLWGYWGEWDISEFVKISLFFEDFYFLKLYVANYLRATNQTRRFQYGMAILRAPPTRGFSVLGLGDMSNECTEPMNSDIIRLSLRI